MDHLYHCRLCANRQPKHLMYDSKNDIEKVSSKLRKINVLVDFSLKNLPNSVCFMCMSSVNNAYDLVLTIDKAQVLLKEKFLPPKIKEEVIEDKEVINLYDSMIESVDTNRVKIEIDEDMIQSSWLEKTTSEPMKHINLLQVKTLKSGNANLNIDGLKSNGFFQPIKCEQLTEKCLKTISKPVNLVEVKTPKFVNLNIPAQKNLGFFQVTNTSKEMTEKCVKTITVKRSNLVKVGTPVNLNIAALTNNGFFLPTNTGEGSKTDSNVAFSPVRVYVTKNSIAEETLKKQTKDCDTTKLNVADDKSKRVDNEPNGLYERSAAAWEKFRWICFHCHEEFNSQPELTAHSIENHKCCHMFYCPDCKRRTSELRHFIRHVMRHNNLLTLTCYNCKDYFFGKTEFKKHKCPQKYAHSCKGCGSQFETEDKLNEHTVAYFKQSNGLPHHLLSNGDFDSLSCKLCNKTFAAKATLAAHLIVHTTRKRDHACKTCGKCFYNDQHLYQHMKSHDKERPFVCDICKQNLKNRQSMISHILLHSEKRFTCDKCDYRYYRKSQLRTHMKVHSDLKPFVCDYCGNGFRLKSVLITHLRQHTGERPFPCQVCEKTFTNWGNCNGHMIRMHNKDMRKRIRAKNAEKESVVNKKGRPKKIPAKNAEKESVVNIKGRPKMDRLSETRVCL